MKTKACALALLSLVAGQARAAPVVWPQASLAGDWLEKFEGELQTHDSATAVLQAWCEVHNLAPGAKITARQAKVAFKPPGPLARQALNYGPKDKVRYRRVDLFCGDRLLSQADNWYLPGRLTPEMNRQLDTTQTPFGVAVAALRFHRRILSTLFLFNPGLGTESWKVVIPRQILRHDALLYTQAGAPFSFVEETYTDQVLAFTPAP